MIFKDLFISYGRRESLGFVARLHQKLKLAGYDAWFDKVNIPDGEDYAARINHGIESAHNFVYVMAPRALCSPYCLIEIEYARVLGKRVIPINQMVFFSTGDHALSAGDQQVLHDFYALHGLDDPNITTVQQVLDRSLAVVGRTDWLDGKEKLSDDDCNQLAAWAQGYENHWHKHDDAVYLQRVELPVFGAAIDSLDSIVECMQLVLERHKSYVEKHTEVLAQALAWQANQHAVRYLAVGKERHAAQDWLLTEFRAGEQAPCVPNALVCAYICEARKNGENLLTDAFICYDVADKAVRDRVVGALSRRAVTTWRHDQDIHAGGAAEQAIRDGIAGADNLLYFISPAACQSAYCRLELEYALSLHKRVIPLLIAEVAELPPDLRDMQYIDLRTDDAGGLDALLRVLDSEADYYRQHKLFLIRALKWQAEQRKPSFLLRGHNLENAKTWLSLNERREQHPPTVLHRELIAGSEAAKGHLGTEVFISYSRKDGDFARLLNLKLQEAGKTTWFDQESISSGVDFGAEILKGIDSADNFLFVISPDAVASEYCENEVRHAASHNKRIITVLARDADPQTMPEALQVLNWIDFRGDFTAAFLQLALALDVDREHVAEHTRLLQQAIVWDSKQRSRDLLLTGTELQAAETWLTEAAQMEKDPAPVDLHKAYVAEGRKQARRQGRWRFALVNLAFLALSGFGLLLMYIAVGIGAEMGEQTYRNMVQSHLSSVRDAKKQQIEAYFTEVTNRVQYFSSDPGTVAMMQDFQQAFPTFDGEVATGSPDYRAGVEAYYSDDFSAEYALVNAGPPPDMVRLLKENLDRNALALQYHYIAANPGPLGAKEEFNAARDPSTYTRLHRAYHPRIRSYMSRFGFHDVYLVDAATGRIVYSVLKQIDFATSLTAGPYAESGLGKVFAAAKRAERPDAIALTDFAPYLPGYQNQAAFIASPIFAGDEKIGIAVFQLSIAPIDDIMTYGRAWRRDESGRTGETIIVAAEDKTLRNDSRFLVEDKATYLQAIETGGLLSPETVAAIKRKDTTVGLQKIDNPTTRAALSGVTGFDIMRDYRGEFVLSAYTPINVPGLSWVVFSNLSEEESYEQVAAMSAGIQEKLAPLIALPFIPLVLYYLFLVWQKEWRNLYFVLTRKIQRWLSALRVRFTRLRDFLLTAEAVPETETGQDAAPLALPPLEKGGRGGFAESWPLKISPTPRGFAKEALLKIPPNPPFPKGGIQQIHWRRALILIFFALACGGPLFIYTTLDKTVARGEQALIDKVQSRLSAIRDAKKQQIEEYFTRTTRQIQGFSADPGTVAMMRDFQQAFPTFAGEVSSPQAAGPSDFQTALEKYYAYDFIEEYELLNADPPPRMLQLLENKLLENEIALQYHYIAANPNPLGTKEALDAARDPSAYTRFHRTYHPHLRDYINRFGFHDLYLVDAETGHIVYSVLKQIDFATSLREGPYAESAIAEAFKAANQAAAPDYVTLTDFAPYLPGYRNQAAFIAAPIFAGEQKIGVAVFQLSIDPVNDIMAHGHAWRVNAFGHSGEAILVSAQDNTLRNDSRFLVEDREAYLEAVAMTTMLSAEVLDTIKRKNTTVGLQKLDNPVTRAAFSGISGFDIVADYRGEIVLSAYAPVEVAGLSWAILSNLSEQEAARQLAALDVWMQDKTPLIVLPFVLLVLYALFLWWRENRRQNHWGFVLVHMLFLLTAAFGLRILFIALVEGEPLGEPQLRNQVQNHLTTVRDRKKHQLEAYFTRVNHHIRQFAAAPATVSMMAAFKQAFPAFAGEIAADGASLRDAVAAYYTLTFTQEYEALNIDPAPNMIRILEESLTQNALALQYHYIAANPNPPGTKEALNAARDSSTYSRLHRTWHPYLRDYLTRFGFQDLYLVDAESGQIVYSVQKKIDFATSLRTGPYAESGLARVFDAVAQAATPVALVDFAPYLPAYRNPAAFIAAPIFAGEQKIGVAVLQLAVEPIDHLMSDGRAWRYDESGAGGEAMIVAATDHTLRNDPRLLVEDRAAYLQVVETTGLLSWEALATIKRKDSATGLQKMDNLLTHAAFHGISGFDIMPDYRGEQVFSAYAPVDVPGLSWTVFANLPVQEAYAPLKGQDIREKMFFFVVLLLVPLFLYALLCLLKHETNIRQT